MNTHLKLYVDKVMGFACCSTQETMISNDFYFYVGTLNFVSRSALSVSDTKSHKFTVNFRDSKVNTPHSHIYKKNC